jgi:hypothetical protein
MNLRNVLRQFFGMPNILRPLTKLLPEPVKLSRGDTMAKDALTNGSMLLRSDMNIRVFA